MLLKVGHRGETWTYWSLWKDPWKDCWRFLFRFGAFWSVALRFWICVLCKNSIIHTVWFISRSDWEGCWCCRFFWTFPPWFTGPKRQREKLSPAESWKSSSVDTCGWGNRMIYKMHKKTGAEALIRLWTESSTQLLCCSVLNVRKPRVKAWFVWNSVGTLMNHFHSQSLLGNTFATKMPP